MDPLQAHVLSLVTAVVAVAVGLGLFGHETEQLVVSIAGVALAAVFQVINLLHVKVKAGQ